MNPSAQDIPVSGDDAKLAAFSYGLCNSSPCLFKGIDLIPFLDISERNGESCGICDKRTEPIIIDFCTRDSPAQNLEAGFSII